MLARTPLELSSHVALEVGRLSARGVSLENAREFHDLWLAPELGMGIAQSLGGGLELTARGGALLPLLRERYAVDGELVHRPALLGWRAALGLSWVWR